MTDAPNDAINAPDAESEVLGSVENATPAPQAEATNHVVRLVSSLARLLADVPDQISVETVQGPGTVLLRLTPAPADVGKLVGRQGRTVRSLRTILSAASANSPERYTLDIVEPL